MVSISECYEPRSPNCGYLAVAFGHHRIAIYMTDVLARPGGELSIDR